MSDTCCPAEHRSLTIRWQLGTFRVGFERTALEAVAEIADQPALLRALPVRLCNQIVLAVLSTATTCLDFPGPMVTIGPILFHREDMPDEVWEATA